MSAPEYVTKWLEKLKQANSEAEADRLSGRYEKEKAEKEMRKLEREEKRRAAAQLKAEKEKEGYVYLLHSENGFYKIGKAKVVRQRLKDWQRTYPLKITLVHSIACKDRGAVENTLHNMFKKKRAQLEWYKLDEDDVKHILSLRDYELG